MTETTAIAPTSVQVRPGDGRLLRTAHSVLFLPEPGDGWDELRAALEAPEAAGQSVAPIAQVLASRALEAPAFVLVSWVPRVAVMVFGDVELRTDHPAVPMLTGRGSQTWVEHSVPSTGEAIVLSVEAPEPDDDTDLTGGAVPASGFRMELATVAPRDEVPAATNEPAPVEEPSPVVESAPPPAEADAPTMVLNTPAPQEPAPAPATTTWQPPPLSNDPQLALGAIQDAAVTDEDPAGPPAPDAPAPAGNPASAAPGNPAQAPAGDPAQAPAGDHAAVPDGHPLVDAAMCGAGHANPPSRHHCRTCQEPLPAEAALRTVPRPPLGTVTFDDGEQVELDADLVLGRRPPEDGRRIQVLRGDRVSRHHAEVILRGWEVLIHDPGSRNGTYVVLPDAQDPVRVEPGIPVRIESGAKVYLGTRSFVFDETATLT